MAPLVQDAALRLLPYVALAALPVVAVAATAFAKALVVTAALRTGLAAERLLPAPVVWVLALLLTTVVMLPVFEGPASHLLDTNDPAGAADLLWRRWSAFLAKNATAEETAFFSSLTGRPAQDPLVLVASFFSTELIEALSMAVSILAPFLAVDLIVAQGLVLVSMTNLPAPVVAVPIKLALFLSVDGMHLLVRGFVEGYP